MLNKFLTKKTALFLLLIIFFLLSFSNYIKTDDNLLDQFFEEEKTKKAEADSSENLLTQENIKEEKSISKKPEIIKLASIEEIKDPFYTGKNENASSRDPENNFLDLKIDSSLNVLEKDIRAVELLDNKNKKDSKGKEDISPASADEAGENTKDEAAAEEIDLKKIELPFSLIGIVKNRELASVLFNYQGKTVLKKERDKIDFFLIEKIELKKVIISFEDQKLELKLWGADIVEKEK